MQERCRQLGQWGLRKDCKEVLRDLFQSFVQLVGIRLFAGGGVGLVLAPSLVANRKEEFGVPA